MAQRRAACWILLLFLCVSCRGSRDPIRVTVSVPYENTTLDPHRQDKVYEFAIHSNFYEPLVSTDRNMKIQPSLAESWETPDPYTWIFHLRSGVRFHSGKALRAKDVVYTYQRILQHEDLEIRTYLRDVTDVTALDPLTVRIRTQRPLVVFLNLLNFVLIIPAGSTAEQLAAQVNGTGPYLLAEREPGKRVLLRRNPSYWGEKPEIEQVAYRLARSPDEAIRDFVSGASQLIQSNSKKLEDVVSSSAHYEMLFRDSLMLKYVGFDIEREATPYCKVTPNPFKNPLVRRAIHLGVDRLRLTSRLPTYAAPATQPVPPFVFGFNPQITAGSYHPDQAKSLLARAGLADGFTATLHVRKILEDTARSLQQELDQIGIHLELLVLSDSDFFKAVSSRDVSIFLNRYGCLTGDASELADALHTTQLHRNLGNRNYGNFSSSEADTILEENPGIQNMAKRQEGLQRLMALVMEELPWIPLYFDQEVYAIDRKYSWQPRYDGTILSRAIHIRRVD